MALGSRERLIGSARSFGCGRTHGLPLTSLQVADIAIESFMESSEQFKGTGTNENWSAVMVYLDMSWQYPRDGFFSIHSFNLAQGRRHQVPAT